MAFSHDLCGLWIWYCCLYRNGQIFFLALKQLPHLNQTFCHGMSWAICVFFLALTLPYVLTIAVTNLLDKETVIMDAGRVLLHSQVAESQKGQVCFVVAAPAMLLFACLWTTCRGQGHVCSDTSSVLSLHSRIVLRIKSLIIVFIY